MSGLSGLLTALNIAGNVANTVGTIAGAAKDIGGALGGWGQTGSSQSMLKQMGYNTLQAIMQGVYNHIENTTAMSYNSAEALKNREWQEHMSNTSYQRAVLS